jgi:hypothetical protein
MKASKNVIIYIFSLSLILASCATIRDYSAIEKGLYSGNYENAYTQLEAEKKDLYSDHDVVLYSLDSGMISHYGTNWEQSNIALSTAEKYMEEYSAKSITQTFNSYVLNDTIQDYAGEDYENVYTNLFMALNYIHLEKYDDAMVEIRRFDNKLKVISLKYAEAIENAKKQVASNNYSTNSQFQTEALNFHNSALARYVSMLLYRDMGDIDNARIDKTFIDTAFSTQTQLYPFKKPSSLDAELKPVPQDFARLNFISNSGLAPEKQAETIRILNNNDGSYFKFEIPDMVKQKSIVTLVKVAITDIDGNFVQTVNLEPIESIESVAVDTFKQKQVLIYLKSLLRSISKSATSSVIVNNTDNSNMASLIRVLSNIVIEVSEKADIRTSHFFPAMVWVGGITVPQGSYSVTVTYYSANNPIETINYQNVQVLQNRPNIVESTCVK